MIAGNPDDRACPGCDLTFPAMVFLTESPAAVCYRCRQIKRARGDRRRYHARVRRGPQWPMATAWDQRPFLAGTVSA